MITHLVIIKIFYPNLMVQIEPQKFPRKEYQIRQISLSKKLYIIYWLFDKLSKVIAFS